MASSRPAFAGSFTAFADGLDCVLTLESDGERGVRGSLQLGDLALVLRGTVAEGGAGRTVAHGLVLEPGGALRALWRAAPSPGGIVLELRVLVPAPAATPSIA